MSKTVQIGVKKAKRSCAEITSSLRSGIEVRAIGKLRCQRLAALRRGFARRASRYL